MQKRLSIPNAALWIMTGAAFVYPLMAQTATCSRTSLGVTGSISSTASAAASITYTVSGTLGPIISGTDPLGLNGQAGVAKATISASAMPSVSATSASVVYSLPPGSVTLALGTTVSTNATPWNMIVTLATSGDTFVLTGEGPGATVFTSKSALATKSFSRTILKHPIPFKPSPQKLTSPSSTLSYSTSCIVGVAAGSDYFVSAPGTQATILSQTIPLTGVPIQGSNGQSLGNTDTIVQRMGDAIFSADVAGRVGPNTSNVSIPIAVTALSLTGTYGVAPNSCTMDVTIQPSPASSGVANLTVNAAGTGGTFTATFTVYFIATFTPIAPNTAAGCPATLTGHHTMTLKGGQWSTTPQPGELLVQGVYPDPNANQHTGMPPGFVDFYAKGLRKHLGVTVQHFVCEAVTSGSSVPCK